MTGPLRFRRFPRLESSRSGLQRRNQQPEPRDFRSIGAALKHHSTRLPKSRDLAGGHWAEHGTAADAKGEGIVLSARPDFSPEGELSPFCILPVT